MIRWVGAGCGIGSATARSRARHRRTPSSRCGRARWTTPRGGGRRRTSGPAARSPGSRCPRAARASRRSPRTALRGCGPPWTTNADQTTDPISIALRAISIAPSRERSAATKGRAWTNFAFDTPLTSERSSSGRPDFSHAASTMRQRNPERRRCRGSGELEEDRCLLNRSRDRARLARRKTPPHRRPSAPPSQRTPSAKRRAKHQRAIRAQQPLGCGPRTDLAH